MARELPVCNVAILHDKFRNTPEDRYMVDIALALDEKQTTLSIYTTDSGNGDILDSTSPLDKYIRTVGTWIPSNVCGAFKRMFAVFRSIWLTSKLLIDPPSPEPSVVILDLEPIAILLLSLLSNYKTLYIYHFPHLRCSDHYDKSMCVVPPLLTLKSLRYADEIIVQTKCLREVFQRSFPDITEPLVLTPSYSTGLWNADTIDVRRIIPDLPTNYKLFVAFGKFMERSNFLLILEAIDKLMISADNNLKEELHVVIAGSYRNRSPDYYNKLTETTKGKPFASKISFLKQLPTVHKKTLIQAATAVIHLVDNDLYPGPIVAAMSMAKAIISIDCGFASTVLTHRISGIFIEQDATKLATVIRKVAESPMLKTFLGNMARGKYLTDYSHKTFSDQIFSWCTRSIPDHYRSEDD
ncbi:hypothetical protein PPYR_13996 [Photinus pyralis]|uniref:Alpha-1,3/1,6-mannosyltransferase ALG2 n=1 Tax=Photinus pyralis TaxID=7054 RepID=A0A5N4A3X7_PHOPY|nr:alpha-1,3/1,6-mannosyltransferase alg2-like [Photinus pyralis]KAB0792035.1 hypothetical protein PPYR_13996 [Photinus pyralis]